MRILVSADLHANIIAAEEIINISKKRSCDMHIHIGDSINIGPWPNETIEILRNNNVVMLKGNHEEYCTSKGLSNGLLGIISDNELNHHKWTKRLLTQSNIDYLEKLDYEKTINLAGINISFLHFFRENNRISEYNVFEKGIDNNNFDELFQNENDVIIFGHLHSNIEIVQNKKYISFGSSGCTGKYCRNKSIGIIETKGNALIFEQIQLEWDQDIVRKELTNKKVPDRELISAIFLN